MSDLNEVNTMLAERVKQWTEEWKAEGMQAGRLQGRQEGEAALLLRQLTRKFGPLDESTRARVLAADAEQLMVWGERLLSAETLEELFEA